MKTCLSLTTSIILSIAGANQAGAQAMLWQEPGPCDRECLIDIADRYLTAMVAHEPEAAPLASDIRFTENTEPMNVGEGLWATASTVPESFDIRVPDPVSQQIGLIAIMEEGGEPIQLGLRLKLEDGEITEAEQLVVRSFREGTLENLRTPRPGLLATVPRNQRLPREIMLAIGMTYYDSIEQSDGDATPFADDCERRENGIITAGGEGIGMFGTPRQGCREQMFSRVFTYIDSIDLRRVWIADEVTGLVFGLSQFRHSMENKVLDIIDSDGNPTTREMNFDAFDLPAAHIYKIRDGRIHEIEAMGFTMPYMSSNGWSDYLR